MKSVPEKESKQSGQGTGKEEILSMTPKDEGISVWT